MFRTYIIPILIAKHNILCVVLHDWDTFMLSNAQAVPVEPSSFETRYVPFVM